MMVTEGEWDIEDVAEVFGVLTRSIARWEEQFDQDGFYTRHKGLAGRPRRLSAPVVEEITKLLQENPSLYLDEIIDWLALTHEQPISIGALCDNLRELGLTWKQARNIAAQRDEFVFIDESGKDGHTMIHNYGRAPKGSTPEVEVNHDRGIRYSILPALTLDGYIALHVVEGSVDSEEFFDFIISDVIPHMNPFPGP
uniref:Tc1-like transposase DDE domain-containing protein n=1 Tax=Moniliophthora roreri TaxID=221103 RepID=A0A0W0FAC0_MONRR